MPVAACSSPILTAAASSLWWCALVIDEAHAVSQFIAAELSVTPGALLRAPLEPLLTAVETANTGLAVFIALLYLVFGFFVLYLPPWYQRLLGVMSTSGPTPATYGRWTKVTTACTSTSGTEHGPGVRPDRRQHKPARHRLGRRNHLGFGLR